MSITLANPGVLMDERLAEIRDEGQNASNAWALEIHLGAHIDESETDEEVLRYIEAQMEADRYR